MAVLARVPHGFLRRHLSMVERVFVAGGVSLLLYGLMVSLPAYPSPWQAVTAVTVFFVLLWSPTAGYFLAVAAALYPLYTLSLYLAVLFLAVALLGQRVFIHNLGPLLLVLAAPWLAQYHLEWIAVLLSGLWFGKTAGAWTGGLAALWGQIFFGMTGQFPNWLDMMGIAPNPQGLFAQFKDANSLETLKLILTPLAPNPTLLLFHLLQIVLWALAAGLVGGLVETAWVQQKHPWRAAAITIFGAAGMVLGNLGLASWLNQYRPDDFGWLLPGLMESALYASVAAVGLEVLRDFVEHPFPAPLSIQRVEKAAAPARPPLLQRIGTRLRVMRRPVSGSSVQPAQPAVLDSYPPIPVPENLPHKDSKKQPPDDIIKIELD